MQKIRVEIDPKSEFICGDCDGRRGSCTCWIFESSLNNNEDGEFERLTKCLNAEIKED